MRPVFWSALLGVALLSYGQEAKRPATPPQVGSAPAALSPKTAAPANPEPGGAIDPAKLAAPGAAAKPSGEKTFVIGAEDVLFVQIWGDPRLNGTYVVRPDGRISVSLLGEFEASGKTAEQLGTEISDRLKTADILKEIRVNVNVQQINSRKITIIGEVNKPGSYPLIIPTTALEALVNAGNFRDFANQKNIIIQRGAQRFKFNYKEVIAGKNLKQNILLEPGDHIIVK